MGAYKKIYVLHFDLDNNILKGEHKIEWGHFHDVPCKVILILI